MGELKAAFGKVNITPEEIVPLQGYDPASNVADPATDILDDLFARILLLDDGSSRTVMISVDCCMITEELTKVCSNDEYRDFVAMFPPHTRKIWGNAADVPEEQVSVYATHTHSAPVHFGEKYTARIEQKIRELAGQLVPVNVRLSTGTSGISVYRRPTLRPNFEVPVNQTLNVLLFETADGMAIGSVVVYAVHPTVLSEHDNPRGYHFRVSSEFVGLAMSELEAAMGDPFVSLYLQGFSGDVGIVYGNMGEREDTYPQVKEAGRRFCSEIASVLEAGKEPLGRTLKTIRRTVSLPVKEGYPELTPAPLLTISGTRIGNAVILAVSAEVFNEYMDKISARCPESVRILFAGVANGYSGYLPTREAYLDGLGGYEVGTTPFTLDADEPFVDEAVRLVMDLIES